MLIRKALIGAGLLGIAVSANATVISGSGLQNGLNAVTVGSDFLDVNTDQFVPDQVWSVAASGASVSRLIFEFAGFESTNTFGVYDVTDPSKRLELFDGPACGTADTTCVPADNLALLDFDGGTTFTNVLESISMTFGSSSFGYYLDSSSSSGGGLFFSQAGLNSDVADAAHENTTDHMVAYAGDGSLVLDIFPPVGVSGGIFDDGEFILAWEDLMFPASDYDYSDMVVLVESVVPIPEPASLALLGLGLLGLGMVWRRTPVRIEH